MNFSFFLNDGRDLFTTIKKLTEKFENEVNKIDNSDKKKEDNPTLIIGYFIPNSKGILDKLSSHPKIYKEI